MRILVGGDSTAVVLTVGMASWAAGHPDHAAVSSRWCPGCGFLLEGEIVTAGMDSEEPSAAFTGTQLLASVDSLQPDVVVLMSTITDVADRVWPDDDRRIGPTDPRYRAALTEAYADITMRLLAAGAPHVVWIVPPVPLAVLNGPEMNEPERYEVQHAVIRETVARFTGSPVSAIDLEGWMVAADHASDSSWRPDGVHLTEEAAAVIAEQFLGPLLVATALS